MYLLVVVLSRLDVKVLEGDVPAWHGFGAVHPYYPVEGRSSGDVLEVDVVPLEETCVVAFASVVVEVGEVGLEKDRPLILLNPDIPQRDIPRKPLPTPTTIRRRPDRVPQPALEVQPVLLEMLGGREEVYILHQDVGDVVQLTLVLRYGPECHSCSAVAGYVFRNDEGRVGFEG